MTDAEVTHRVEQAMLGAMMARPRRAAQLGAGPEHFADQRHQAIAAALTGNAGTERGLFGRIMGFFTRRSRAAREAAAYMETLPGLCPEPAHIGTYFQMLAADRDQRAAQAEARVQEQGNQVLDVASERLGQLRGRPDNSTGLPRGTARLARALRDLTGGQREPAARNRPQAPWVPSRGTAPAAGQVPGQSSQGVTPQAPVPQQGNGRPAQTAPGPGPAAWSAQDKTPAFEPGRNARPEDVQDAILAAMMRHPDEAREVIGWLTPRAFTGQRRELFTLISQYDSAGRDIDPVTLAWGAAQAGQPAQDGQRPGRLRPEYVLGLGRRDTAPGAASVLGKFLLADQVVTRELGPDWHLAPRPGTASEEQHTTGTRRPDPDQAQTRQGPAKNQGQPGQKGNGPYRQTRPETGTRPRTRAGTGTATEPVVPGKLIQQPPPQAPGQGGMTPNQ